METFLRNQSKASILTIAAYSAFVVPIASAEPAQRITAEPQANAFFADYEILEGQPECNGTDELAYKMTETLEDIGLRFMDVASGFEQFSGSQHQNFCTRTIRRGTEESTIEVNCPADGIAAVDSNVIDSNAKMDLTIEVFACMSPTSHDVIGGSWSASITNGGYVTTSSGMIFDQTAKQPARFVRTGRSILSKRRTTLGVWVDVVHGGDLRYFWQDENSDFGVFSPLNSRPAIVGMLECLPYSPTSNPGVNLVADVPFVLFTADNQPVTCDGSDCLIFDDRKVFQYERTQCEPPA